MLSEHQFRCTYSKKQIFLPAHTQITAEIRLVVTLKKKKAVGLEPTPFPMGTAS